VPENKPFLRRPKTAVTKDKAPTCTKDDGSLCDKVGAVDMTVLSASRWAVRKNQVMMIEISTVFNAFLLKVFKHHVKNVSDGDRIVHCPVRIDQAYTKVIGHTCELV
jgi:hypothetical protein